MSDVPDLRPLRDTDVADVLMLNERNVVKLGPDGRGEAAPATARVADRFDVLDVDGAFAGFVITFAPGASYDSENYRWFTARHGSSGFYYLDRIVLHEDFRRRGLGGFVYDEIEQVATPYGRLVPRGQPGPPQRRRRWRSTPGAATARSAGSATRRTWSR